MTKGIRVIWPDEKGGIDEIEYFCGIDINNLDYIPTFSSVPADWPGNKQEPSVEYNIDVRFERIGSRQVRLIVDYDEGNNPELSVNFPDLLWGTNTIILEKEKREGRCEWLIRDARRAMEVPWEAFDLEASHERPHFVYRGSKREAHFRNVIVTRDGHRCVLTGDQTTEAVEAAHLVPARNGENDMPFNGIALRADLHRLFDAHLFTLGENGQVVITDSESRLSAAYRALLHAKCLPPATFERVKATLSLEHFRNRHRKLSGATARERNPRQRASVRRAGGPASSRSR